MSQADKAMLAALRAMAEQLTDETTRDALVAVLDGNELPKPDALRQEVLSGAEAARVLGVTSRTVQALAKAGAIARAVLPGRVRGFGYMRASVEALARGRTA